MERNNSDFEYRLHLLKRAASFDKKNRDIEEQIDFIINQFPENERPLAIELIENMFKYLHNNFAYLIESNYLNFKNKKDLGKKHNSCITDDPDDICDNCSCWKSTRRNCS
jgi:hypothetical protein